MDKHACFFFFLRFVCLFILTFSLFSTAEQKIHNAIQCKLVSLRFFFKNNNKTRIVETKVKKNKEQRTKPGANETSLFFF